MIRNSILDALSRVWGAKPQNIDFAKALRDYKIAFEDMIDFESITPAVAESSFEFFLKQFDTCFSETESKKAPSKQIEPLLEKQNEISFLCECGAKFPTVQARSGHKKGCKI